MKNTLSKIFILLAVPFFLTFCKNENAEREVYMFTSFHEPAIDGLRLLYSYDGYKWDSIPGIFIAPEIGIQKVMRDPSIVQGSDGTFHFVWTTSWRGDLGFGYSSSKDLKNWSEQRFIPVMEYDTTTVNVWAPELYYEKEANEFYIVWASTIPYKFERGIEAEDNNHRLYYTKTTDFETFTKAELLYDPGFNSIDAVIVKREESDYVLVFKDNTRLERNLKVAFGQTPVGPYSESSEPFTPNRTEGPSVVKIGDEWVVFFDAYQENGAYYGAMTTKDFKTFTDIREKTTIPKGHKHGTVFKVKESILKELLNN